MYQGSKGSKKATLATLHRRRHPLRAILVGAAAVVLLFAAAGVQRAYTAFHLWDINEVFSNADGSVQFIEMINPTNDSTEGLLSGHDISSNANSFVFPGDLVGDTAFKTFLIGTQAFADDPGFPDPDYIIPASFFDPNGDTLDFAGFDSFTFGPLPINGDSLNQDDTTGAPTPVNFAGVAVPPPGLDDPIPETIAKGTITIELQPVIAGLTAPVHLTHAGDGSGRLFIVDQDGEVHILQGGALLPDPFLDVSGRLVALGFFGTMDENDFDERGLLGLAFHPDFTDSAKLGYRKLYTYTSEPVDGRADFRVKLPRGTKLNHQAVIAEWTVDEFNADQVDPTSRREILRIDEPQFNHDGGMVEFGPDGYLYISLGDGGGGNDVGDGHGTDGNGQDPTNVLGTILRIDPIDASLTRRTSDGDRNPNRRSRNREYRIPADNPFAGRRHGGNRRSVREIFAYGFRNPFRFNFDSLTGDLIVGDVGQNQIEEVDIVVSGGNYGWNLKEGSFRFDSTFSTVSDDLTGLPGDLIDPVLEYDHDEGITVIGGFVYRGSAIPELVGKYVFGDFSGDFFIPSGRLFYADLASGVINELILGALDLPLDLFVKAFGQDADGELYVLAGTNLGPFGAFGEVLKITPFVP